MRYTPSAFMLKFPSSNFFASDHVTLNFMGASNFYPGPSGSIGSDRIEVANVPGFIAVACTPSKEAGSLRGCVSRKHVLRDRFVRFDGNAVWMSVGIVQSS